MFLGRNGGIRFRNRGNKREKGSRSEKTIENRRAGGKITGMSDKLLKG